MDPMLMALLGGGGPPGGPPGMPPRYAPRNGWAHGPPRNASGYATRDGRSSWYGRPPDADDAPSHAATYAPTHGVWPNPFFGTYREYGAGFS